MINLRPDRQPALIWGIASCLWALQAGCSSVDLTLDCASRRQAEQCETEPAWAGVAAESHPPANVEPLRAGSTVLQPPSGTEAHLAVASQSQAMSVGVVNPAGAVAPNSAATPETMSNVLRELQSLERLSTAEQQRLLDTLKTSEPASWPQVVRNFRDTLAASKSPASDAGQPVQQVSHNEPVGIAAPPTTVATATSVATPAAVPTASEVSVPAAPAWKEQLTALIATMTAEVATAAPGTAAEAVERLDQAGSQIRRQLPLELRGLVFCTEVTSFGVYRPLAEQDFAAGQEVLLYAEVENFDSESLAEGFRTELESQYTLVDSSGKPVAERKFGPTRDLCRQPRRDFFVRYQFHLPDDLPAGTYTLQLTVTDLLAKKSAQGSIELAIQSKQ